MTLKDLIEVEEHAWQNDAILKGEIIALDGRDGKVLFDSRRNKKEHIQKYLDGKIISLWADARRVDIPFGAHFIPVIKVYLSHGSWKDGESE